MSIEEARQRKRTIDSKSRQFGMDILTVSASRDIKATGIESTPSKIEFDSHQYDLDKGNGQPKGTHERKAMDLTLAVQFEIYTSEEVATLIELVKRGNNNLDYYEECKANMGSNPIEGEL